MARPTKYTEELLAEAREYLDSDLESVHSIAGLAIHLKVSRDTLHAWARDDDKTEFSYIYEELLSKQEQKLLSEGLTGGFNSTITKLMLTKHGYSDKSQSELTGRDGEPIKVDTVWEVRVVDVAE